MLYAELSDSALVHRSPSGDDDAFAELWQRRWGLVCSVVYGCMASREGMGDIAQETFVKAWTRLHALKTPDSFAAWVACIARRESAQHVRFTPRAALGRPPSRVAPPRARVVLPAGREDRNWLAAEPHKSSAEVVLTTVYRHTGDAIGRVDNACGVYRTFPQRRAGSGRHARRMVVRK
jgi:DNA-directed RNA polymerase specialized sigma24 family protein